MSDRTLLQKLVEGPCSGEVLAAGLGIGRAAVWKRIQALRAEGVVIEAVPGRGYALAAPLSLLDAEVIAAALPMALRARLPAPEVVWDIDSTQAELLRRGADCADGATLFAERQRGGRGRRGRAWASPLAANLYFSLHRRFEGGVATLGGLSLAVGVAVAEALRGLGFRTVGLKWPNDLVCADRKLGGLLVDLVGEAGGPVSAVIGIGLNVCMPPAFGAAIDQPWTDLQAQGGAPDRNALAASLLARLWPALDVFAAEGLGPFLARWEALDALAGRPVRVLWGERREEGMALGIAADGALRVALAEGERRYHGGEVSLRLAGDA